VDRFTWYQGHAVVGGDIAAAAPQIAGAGVVVTGLEDQRPGITFAGGLDLGPGGGDFDGAGDCHTFPPLKFWWTYRK